MFDIELFWLALGFYTRLPCPKHLNYARLPQAGVYLPVIGWLVGGVTGLSYYVTSLVWGQTPSVILALITGVLLTGAFHEDGFADVCDGFGGGYGRERILEIMKDSRSGVYGVLGLVMIISLKISSLRELPPDSIALVLLAGHSISRLPPLLLMQHYDYARHEGSKGSAAVFRPSPGQLIFAGGVGLLPLILLPVALIWILPVLYLLNSLLGHYFHRHIGGYTGDCLGASQQVAETVFYLGAGALWTST
jgi:adenosylcobinamide-GDP ribazoletransferase